MNVSFPGLSRRSLIKSALVAGGVAATGAAIPKVGRQALSARPATNYDVPSELMERAMAALDRHGQIKLRDRIAIADFSEPSSAGRLHLLDLANGRASTMLVSHGRGSDPAHTGWLKSFSNTPGSNATSQGAYVTGDYYVGNHGRSQRLEGLDPTNDNAMARAIVIHSAWYAEPTMIRDHGMLGRSEGCFAVGSAQLDPLFSCLGEGRMIYADKV